MKNYKSIIVLTILFIFICIVRIKTLSNNELCWDVFGYYLYLPATIIHHDPLLKDISWVHQVMSELPISGTLYQLNRGPDNTTYFFLMGMSILYSPFFFTGHIIALLTNFSPDGFSLPYQYSIALGLLIYTLLGLILLRKILLQFFNDWTTALVIMIIVIGTNYIHFVTYKNLDTANSLFFLLAVTTWFTIRWHQTFKLKYLIIISISVALTTLAKPSEIFCILIPVLWGIYNKKTLQDKTSLVFKHFNQFIIAGIIFLLLVIPQIIYWKIDTGEFLYDSYINPGVGLDFQSPHIIKVLCSYRKGWLLYTPVMIFALAGFVYLYKSKRELFFSILIYFLITFYIVASWTEWWYGASFSVRPMITTYVVLSIPLGMTIEKILRARILFKILFLTVIGFFVILNLFQWWQLNTYILDPYRTTKEYYFAIFGKTKVAPETRNLLSIERSFTGYEKLKNESDYNKRIFGYFDFSQKDTNRLSYYLFDTLSNSQVLKLDSANNFSPNIRIAYQDITKKDHAWMRAGVDILIPDGYDEELPCLIMTFNRKEGNYCYRSNCIDTTEYHTHKNQWMKISMDYLTPEIRNKRDIFQAYIWHRGKKPIYIDNFKVDIYEPKD
ncbi:MAG: hypothetical protein JW723_15565 [Bacteroidales bacterium]|nr:hypothetical protein [Bacteroidales bacterium]